MEETATHTQTFGLDIFGRGGGLPRCEGVGAKKFGVSFESQGHQTFLAGYPGILPDILGLPEKFEKKEVCVQFFGPIIL